MSASKSSTSESTLATRSSASDTSGRKGGPKKVAECCMDLLHIEIIALYTRLQQKQQQQPAQARNELMARRMEAIGFQVGQQLVERYTLDRSRFSEHLDVFRFICKDFWAEVFRKHVDNLKTNHRGVYVLQDNKFRWLARISPDSSHQPAAEGAAAGQPAGTPPAGPATPPLAGGKAKAGAAPGASGGTGSGGGSERGGEKGAANGAGAAGGPAWGSTGAAVSAAAAAASASQYLVLPCGILKGALTNLGVPCTVTAEVTTLPACSFTVRIKS